jgi:hypothetical protein
MKYQSPRTYYSKVITKVSIQYVGQTNTHVKYQSPDTYHSKGKAKVIVFSKSNVNVKVTRSNLLVPTKGIFRTNTQS